MHAAAFVRTRSSRSRFFWPFPAEREETHCIFITSFSSLAGDPPADRDEERPKKSKKADKEKEEEYKDKERMKIHLAARRMRSKLLEGGDWEKDIDTIYHFDIKKQRYCLCPADEDMDQVGEGWWGQHCWRDEGGQGKIRRCSDEAGLQQFSYVGGKRK